MKDIEGWKVGSLFGVRSFYNGAVEAMYPMTRDDATGEAIDTGQHNYTLTLTAGQSPPVNAFWSLTMYDSKSQLLIEMPGPNGPAYLVMRLYWPKTEAPSILPAGDGTGRPPGIVKAS
jgi:hypothetical protein